MSKQTLTSNDRPILQLKEVDFAYKPDYPVLKNITFDLYRGESLGIIGPNGGGKSTLLKVIVGLLRPNNGQIFINGKKISQESDFPRHLIAYVPQHTSLNHLLPLSVVDLIQLNKANTRPFWKRHKLDQQDLDDQDKIIKLVGLQGKEHRNVRSLSQGELQRVLLARALVLKPEILILDEPHTGLDTTGQDLLLGALEKYQNENMMTIIQVDHHLNQTIKHSDKLICLNKTHHWHNYKEHLTKHVLESIYHCEFEHLVIHDQSGEDAHHHQCEQDHGHDKPVKI